MKFLLLIGIALYFLSRFILSQIQRKEESSIKRYSYLLLGTEAITIGIILLQIFFSPIQWENLKAESVSSLGHFFFILGIFLSILGRFSLGENWRTARDFARPLKLVTTGIYAKIRHPIYFGSWLMGIGFELCLGSWLLIPVIVFGLPFIWICAVKEERLMDVWFGQEYRIYEEKTKRFIPWIF